VLVGLSCCVLTGCGALEDEGVRLARRIGDEAQALRRSPKDQLVFSYIPRSGTGHRYSIGAGRSAWCPTPPCDESRREQTSLTVSVERGRHGSTTVHKRFVAVPRALEVRKNGEPTQIVLRKNHDVVELVELR
jgi:hypothetical protein